jgi:hypothetical protein
LILQGSGWEKRTIDSYNAAISLFLSGILPVTLRNPNPMTRDKDIVLLLRLV